MTDFRAVARLLAASVLAAAAALVAAGAQATIIYNNGGPNSADGNDATQWLQAENFTIAGGANITGAGVYLAGFDGLGAWDGVLDYYFFADAAGSPGGVLAQGAAQNLVATDTGLPWCCGGNSFLIEFDLLAPFNASAGTTYWFGIHASGDFDTRDDIYFVTTDYVTGNGNESAYGTQDNWFNNTFEHAFFLTSADVPTVPEPLSLALVGLGLAALRLTRRR